MNDPRVEVAFDIHGALIGGTVKDVAVFTEGIQVWIAGLDIEKNGHLYRFWFKGPQEVNEVIH